MILLLSSGGGAGSGTPGADGALWYATANEPDVSIGVNGDFAIDASTASIYQKSGGAWSLVGNIQGAPGAPGATGASGPPGQPGPASAGTYLVSGAGVAWVSGLTYRIGAAVYYIAGTKYTSAEAEITMDTADVSYDRIDVIALDATGSLVKINGDAATEPAQPDVDPASYVAVTFVYIPVGATAVATKELVYAEDVGSPTEWPVTPSAGTIVKNSTNNPRSGSKCIEGTAVTTAQSFTAIRSATFDLATRNNLIFYIRNKAAFVANRPIRLRFYNGTTPLGVAVTIGSGAFGFNRSTIGVYQQIVVPLSKFTISAGILVDRVKFEFPGSGANVGFYIDDISVQSGVDQTVFAAPAIRWRGEWSATTSYAINDAVSLDGSSYLCLNGNLNKSPDTSASYWGTLAEKGADGGAGTWVDIVFNAADFAGDGVIDSFGISAPETWQYMLSGDTMTLSLNAYDVLLNDTYGGATFCGYFRVKMPASKKPKQYSELPCTIGLPSGTPCSWGGGYYKGTIYCDPTNGGWLDIYADMSINAGDDVVDAGVFPVDAHTITVGFSITIQVEAV
jgi:hypothetical protein